MKMSNSTNNIYRSTTPDSNAKKKYDLLKQAFVVLAFLSSYYQAGGREGRKLQSVL